MPKPPPGSFVPPEYTDGDEPLVVAPNGNVKPAPPPDKPRFTPFLRNSVNGTLDPTAMDWPYAQLLGDSMMFPEVQRSGDILGAPGGHRIPWRGNQLMDDGIDVGLNLTGGHYEAGSARPRCPAARACARGSHGRCQRAPLRLQTASRSPL